MFIFILYVTHLLFPGNCLENNKMLVKLNLSGNMISSFKVRYQVVTTKLSQLEIVNICREQSETLSTGNCK